jgi:hypothetical protein
MAFYRLVIGVLVVWRITHLFAFEEGPFGVFTRLREISHGRFVGNVLDCFYCLSLWVSIPLAFLTGETLTGRLLLWPGLSAGAILLERFAPDRFLQNQLLQNQFLEDRGAAVAVYQEDAIAQQDASSEGPDGESITRNGADRKKQEDMYVLR